MSNAADKLTERAESSGDTVDLTGDSADEEASSTSDSNEEQQDGNSDPSDDSDEASANRDRVRKRRRSSMEEVFILMYDMHIVYGGEPRKITDGCPSITAMGHG